MKKFFFIFLCPSLLFAKVEEGKFLDENKSATIKLNHEETFLKKSPLPYVILKTENASPNKRYKIFFSNIPCPNATLVAENVAIKDDKSLSGNNGEGIFFLSIGCFGPAESFIIGIASNDYREIGRIKLIPHPIKATQNGYTADLEVADATMKSFYCFISGFEPNEKVKLVSTSVHEKIQNEFNVDEKGEFIVNLLPGVINLEGGIAKAEFTGKKGKVSVEYPWGSEYAKAKKELDATYQKSLREMNKVHA